jgi:ATP-dependent DNA helicase RecG
LGHKLTLTKELTKFIQNNQTDENRWENQVSNRTVDDVDEGLLKSFVKQAQEAGRLSIEYTDKQTVLNQLELTSGSRLLNAGKVLFGDDVIQDIQMAIFAGTERLTFLDIQREHGPVIRLVDLAESYICV